jgi:uncharacterized integral membrane protein
VRPHLYMFCGLHLYLTLNFKGYTSIQTNSPLCEFLQPSTLSGLFSWEIWKIGCTFTFLGTLAYKKQVQYVPKSWKAQNTLAPSLIDPLSNCVLSHWGKISLLICKVFHICDAILKVFSHSKSPLSHKKKPNFHWHHLDSSKWH